MKRFGSVALAACMLIGLSAYSQQGQQPRDEKGKNPGKAGKEDCRMAGLTDEQRQKIDDLRAKHLKDVAPLRSELGEKRAALNTLQSADKPNLKEIDKLIDEMSAIRAKIHKKAAAHRVEVASLLTDEQRARYNAQQERRHDKGMKRGNGKHERPGKHGKGNGREPGHCANAQE